MSRREIFLEAVSKPSAAERSAYLDSACGHNSALREEIERLCRAHDQAGSFLQEPLFDPTPEAAPAPERPGTRIGPYRLLEPIGEGGMGTVWRAEQSEPVRREVAVKVVKPSMASAQMLARFEAERQALALMDHPNIAKVFDAGTVERPGEPPRPYFVMEMVRGVPFKKYCDEHRLTLRQRLELLVTVCQAVQHAHQKGVIHRDLKPGNVLVADSEGGPVPKVIDFGIAKATGTRLTDRTLVTQVGQVVGTLEYMSPEQAQDSIDVDTRSDVYSLGVILYEALTGTRPLELRGAGLVEALRRVREEEPPRPSAHPGATRLTRALRGDLDWISMRCLEKDRDRRYESATALASDLRRYLRHEPVQARPPSPGYRLRKWVRRRPALAAVVAATILIGLGGGGLFLWLDREASARASEEALRLARLSAEVDAAEREARSTGERSAGRVDDLAQWEAGNAGALSAIRRALALASQAGNDLDPALLARVRETNDRLEADERDRRLLARMDDFLVETSKVDPRTNTFLSHVPLASVEEAFRDWGIEYGRTPPEHVARLLAARPATVQSAILAAAYYGFALLGSRERGRLRSWFDRLAEAEQDPWRQAALHALDQGDTDALERLVAELDASSQPPAFLNMLAKRAEKKSASDRYRLVLLRKEESAYPSDFWLNHELAHALDGAEPPQIDEAIRFYTVAIALRPSNPGCWLNLGWTLARRHSGLEAAALAYARAIAIEPSYVMAHDLYAHALRNLRGDPARTIEAFRGWVAAAPDDPMALRALAEELKKHGEQGEATDTLRRAIRIASEREDSQLDLVLMLVDAGELAAAEAEGRKAVERDPGNSVAHEFLGYALGDQGDFAGAEAEQRRALELTSAPKRRFKLQCELGSILRNRGRYVEAAESFRAAIQLDATAPIPHCNLGLVLDLLCDRAAAIESYRTALALRPADPLASMRLANDLFATGAIADSLAVLESAERALPHDHSRTSEIRRLIAEKEDYLGLDTRLRAVLEGRDSPATLRQEWQFAQLAARRGLWRSAARWGLHALDVEPSLATDTNGARKDAAVFATMASVAHGGEEPEATEAERLGWLEKSVSLLRSELGLIHKALETASPRDRIPLRDRLAFLRLTPELAALRDCSGLPVPLQEACRLLW